MIRAATYNIRHASLKGLDAIAELLLAMDADVVALQEVDHAVPRSGSVDQASLLGRATGMESVGGPAMSFQGGTYGVAILSRFPITTHEVRTLPSPYEPRVMLTAVVTPPGEEPLHVVATHLGLHPSERFDQIQTIVRWIENQPRTLLMGDLNEGRTEAAFSLLTRHLVDCLSEAGCAPLLTYPSELPVIGIDHILRSPDLPRTLRCHAPHSLASDHLPVLIELG